LDNGFINCYYNQVAQEAIMPHHEYVDGKKENIIFTPMQLRDLLTKFAAEIPSREVILHAKLEANRSSQF